MSDGGAALVAGGAGAWGDAPADDAALDLALSAPDDATAAALAALDGDLIVLGAGGKMGPSLARMARRALDAVDGGRARRVVAVSRWGADGAAPERGVLEDAGVRTLRADLGDPAAVRALPDAAAVVFMAGQKFGTAAQASATWAMNAWVPALCAARYAGAPSIVFSTGNVYARTPAAGPGAQETDAPAPVGEYAMSCLARERLWEHFARVHGGAAAIIRLNYANALRYGVLTDLALRVWRDEPVDVTMPAVNVLWQGDANRLALRALAHAASPPLVLNVAGPETLRVRDLAHALARRLDRAPRFSGTEAPDALLSDARTTCAMLGAPSMDLATLLDWTAAWVRTERPLLGKPTRFEVRDGAF